MRIADGEEKENLCKASKRKNIMPCFNGNERKKKKKRKISHVSTHKNLLFFLCLTIV